MKKRRKNPDTAAAITTMLLFTLCLAVLKYMGVLKAGLWLVLAPLWIPAAVVVVIIVVVIAQMTREIVRDKLRKRGDGDEQNRH